ncbi:MAG: zinc ribbon domain-containing protein [Methanobrevibacter sp.]|nr:zinc ribbon domain-containing protein [Methanobrevibacter sp.]
MVICPDCGKDVKDAKFCSNCGALLTKSEAEPIPDVEEIDSTLDESSESIEQETIDVVPVESKKFKFCTNCGYELNGEFKFCPECGFDLSKKVNTAKTTVPVVQSEKNIVLAILLSVIFPGLGQFYLGLNHKGVLFLIAYIISAVLILLLIGFLLVLVVWIWALVDTIQSTNALNDGEYVEDKLF